LGIVSGLLRNWSTWDNGYQLWSETYDRQLEDIFALQDDISRSIVDALKLQLVGAGAAVVAPTKSLDATRPI
jgi:hypothetical protein